MAKLTPHQETLGIDACVEHGGVAHLEVCADRWLANADRIIESVPPDPVVTILLPSRANRTTLPAQLLELPATQNLTAVSFKGGEWGPRLAAAIAGGRFPNLRRLDLAYTGTTAEGMLRLFHSDADALPMLESLDFTGCPVGRNAAVLFTVVRMLPPRLTRLEVADCALSRAAAVELSENPAFRQLRELVADGNEAWGDDEASVLLKNLPGTVLWLDFERLSPEIVEQVFERIPVPPADGKRLVSG